MAITLIDEAVEHGARGWCACEILGITDRTLRRWRAAQTLTDRRRRAPRKPGTQSLSAHERQQMLAVCNTAEFQSLPPSQIVPRLADRGLYLASESSFYRVLRAHDQMHRRGRAQAPREMRKPRACKATAPNEIWSWDITYLPTAVRGQFYRLYLVLDVYSRMITGWEIHLDESALHASELIAKACLRHGIGRDQLILHSDNGSPMKGATMLATLQRLGVVPSFSRPSVSDDNPYSEALFRTLKYTPAYPGRPFASLEDARAWVLGFVTWYNTEHRHSGIRFVTPAQRHGQRDGQILAQRRAVYERARELHPERWRGREVRNWTPIGEVWLNPDNPSENSSEEFKLAA